MLKNNVYIWLSILTIVTFGQIKADEVALRDTYPDKYTVVKGDTLWNIAGRFLKSPWQWPQIWEKNTGIKNPDLIYPGDVLVISFVNGRPVLKVLRTEKINNSALKTVKLSPEIRKTKFSRAIPSIDPAAIRAYINSPLVTDEREIDTAGYIVSGVDNRIMFGVGDVLYARGMEDDQSENYRIFRQGRHFVDPITKESLGWEAEHVGDAELLKPGETVKLRLTSMVSDVSLTDRLRAVDKQDELPFFTPKAPDNEEIQGLILKLPTKNQEIGPISIVPINLGVRDGIKPGDVLRIMSQAVEKRDPVTKKLYTVPQDNIGLLLVFRTFERVSYALVTDAVRPVKAFDVLVSPDK